MRAAGCAIGFRVKSGYAVAVVVGGTARTPLAVARRVVPLADPRVDGTRQPYHAGFGAAMLDESTLAKRVAAIERATALSVGALLTEMPTPPRAAALVVGSLIEPEKVANQHIRAHASEGKLFRTVLERALRDLGVTCSVHVEKSVAETARAALHQTDAGIRRTLEAFGRSLGKPWRAEEKSAATAAWMSLPGHR